MLKIIRNNPNKNSEYEKISLKMEKAVSKAEKPFLKKINNLRRSCKHKKLYYDCHYIHVDSVSQYEIDAYCQRCEKLIKTKFSKPYFISKFSNSQNLFIMDLFNDRAPSYFNLTNQEIEEMIKQRLIVLNKDKIARLTEKGEIIVIGRRKIIDKIPKERKKK